MRLMHYDRLPVELDRRYEYEQGEPHPFNKPVGFWVSVEGEDDWPSWCRAEDFRLEYLAVAHEVVLDPAAAIRWITSPAELGAFHAEFSVKEDFLPFAPRWPIDWGTVAERHDGVIIAPYMWSFDGPEWYYGWDCASGCIWNLDAIVSVTATAELRAT